MRKQTISVAFVLIFILSIASTISVSASDRDFNPVTGFDMMERLGLGVSFANTTEARAWPWDVGWYDYSETAWGKPRIQRWNFESIALKGFDSYRLCVTWSTRFMSAPLEMTANQVVSNRREGQTAIAANVNRQALVTEWARNADFTIQPQWLDRVQELVDWALAYDLYVIINTHHEEELYWLIQYNEFELAEELLNSIWSQVAERFADYSERVIFEIMNEPHLLTNYQGEGGWISRDGRTICRELVSMVNRLNESALATIRNSGGNNDRRVVVLAIPGASSSPIPLLNIPNDPYIMVGAFGYYGSFVNSETLPLIQGLVNRGIGFVNKEDGVGHTHVNARNHFGVFADMGVPSFYFMGCASTSDGNRPDYLLNRVTGEWDNGQILRALFAAYGKRVGPDLDLQENTESEVVFTRSDIEVVDRQYPWSGIEIPIRNINLIENDYTITISGRVMNTRRNAETLIALNGRDEPWFWTTTAVRGNSNFTLVGNIGRTFGVENIEQFERGFRIQTIDCTTDFVVDEITIERVG